MSMKASTILRASDIQELRTLGSYYEVKSSLEEELGSKLGVTGWKPLFEKIHILKKTVISNKNYLSAICEGNSFKESKNKISKLLKLKIKARGWRELKSKIKKIVDTFCFSAFDPYEHYERTKLKKFINSSKLEGIEVQIPNEATSLEAVLAKYRR